MKKVLIIDDEENFCEFVKMCLELTHQYEVIMAHKPKKGLKMALKQHPDLILLDLMMPGMTGFEVLEELKLDEETLSIPVIMLTAQNDDESKIASASRYCEDYIVKPVDTEVLREKVADVLSRSGKF